MALNEEKYVSKSGATSSGQKPRYDLIPLTLLRRIADRFGYGARRHAPYNWRRAIEARDKDYILERLNHAMEHLKKAMDTIQFDEIPNDDDLGAVCVNCAFAMEYQEATWADRQVKVEFPSFHNGQETLPPPTKFEPDLKAKDNPY